MWDVGCGVPFIWLWKWAFCIAAKLLRICLRNRFPRLFLIGVCGVHGPSCQEGDGGDYVYSYAKNYIKILIDMIES